MVELEIKNRNNGFGKVKQTFCPGNPHPANNLIFIRALFITIKPNIEDINIRRGGLLRFLFWGRFKVVNDARHLMAAGTAKTLQNNNSVQLGMIVDHGHRLATLPTKNIIQKQLTNIRWKT